MPLPVMEAGATTTGTCASISLSGTGGWQAGKGKSRSLSYTLAHTCAHTHERGLGTVQEIRTVLQCEQTCKEPPLTLSPTRLNTKVVGTAMQLPLFPLGVGFGLGFGLA